MKNTLLIVSHSLSNHTNDFLDGLPTVDAISSRTGKPKRAALDRSTHFSQISARIESPSQFPIPCKTYDRSSTKPTPKTGKNSIATVNGKFATLY